MIRVWRDKQIAAQQKPKESVYLRPADDYKVLPCFPSSIRCVWFFLLLHHQWYEILPVQASVSVCFCLHACVFPYTWRVCEGCLSFTTWREKRRGKPLVRRKRRFRRHMPMCYLLVRSKETTSEVLKGSRHFYICVKGLKEKIHTTQSARSLSTSKRQEDCQNWSSHFRDWKMLLVWSCDT